MIPNIETKNTIEIKRFQEAKLKRLLEYLQANSPFYQKLFLNSNIDIEAITSLEDLSRIPVTTKDDLQQYNDDFICVPNKQIIDYVTTSGTLGDPVVFALTDSDLERLAYNESLSFESTGITQEDILQLMTTMDRRFMAGLAYFLGARKIGASIIRVGAGIPELQWDSIQKFKPSFLIAVPSFILKLIDYANQNNININESSVKAVICIGEPLRDQEFNPNSITQKITASWDIQLFSTYASTEMSTAFTECIAQQGGHHHPELIIAEILDENDKPVASGEVGELTISTLGVEAMPLLRFKTGDMVREHTESCSCGRTTMRLGPVIGRKKQMIKYKGTTLYPPAMHNVLTDFDEVECFVIEISHNDLGTDELLIKIAAQEPSQELLQKIRDHFRAKLRVAPQIEFKEETHINTLRFPKTSRKPVLVIDKREV